MTTPILSPKGCSGALKACLEAEVVPISVHGVRERVLATSRVGKGAAGDSRLSAHLRISWLLGQLKLGLRPVWPAVMEAISLVSQHDEDVVWTSIMEQLSGVEETAQPLPRPYWEADEDGDLDEINESEKMWRDPSAHKMRLVISSWSSYSSCRRQVMLVCQVSLITVH